MADHEVIKRGLIGAIILGIFLLAFLILKPIIFAIIFGLIFAYLFEPLYRKLNKKIHRKSLAAFIIILGMTIAISIPVIYLTKPLITQAYDTYSSLQHFDATAILSKFTSNDFAAALSRQFDSIVGKFFSSIMTQVSGILANLPTMLLQFAVFLFTFFFAMRDSAQLKSYFSELSPFSKSTGRKFLKEFRGITNAIIFGQLLIGIIQGLAVGAGLFFIGAENAIVLTFVACLVSIIPVLGSWLVWLPAGIFLLVSGKTFDGVFLLLYGSLFVSTIDNLIRPYILSKQSNLPVALSIIGTIGGLFVFGIVGLVLGPLILAYVLIIIEFYKDGKLNELFSNKETNLNKKR